MPMHGEERDDGRVDESEEAVPACPACGAETRQEKCKVVCRSERCIYRIVYTCSEF